MATAAKVKTSPTVTPTQLNVLRALVRASAVGEGSGLPVRELVKKLKVSKVMLHFAMGAVDPAARAAHDRRRGERERPGFKSLLSRGYVRVVRVPEEAFVRYHVTPLGVRAFEGSSDAG